jgi:hypothetical protein
MVSPSVKELTYLLVLFEQPLIKHERLAVTPLRNALHIHLDQSELELGIGGIFASDLPLHRHRCPPEQARGCLSPSLPCPSSQAHSWRR